MAEQENVTNGGIPTDPPKPPPKWHANWMCRQCGEVGYASHETREMLDKAVWQDHATRSPDCASKYIATLPHALPH